MSAHTTPVPFYRHGLDRSAADAIGDVLDTAFLTSGSVGKAVEAQIADYFGLPHALLSNSWTNAALAALLAWDLEDGDEVIVPAMTFVACANVVEILGGRAVFCDVDPHTLLMTPETLAAALSPRTRVIMPVHLYGQMVDVAGLRAFLNSQGRNDVKILEDAAHCFEGMRDGARPGTHGDCAIFSFYATKNITCGEGGALVTRDGAFADTVRQTRLHGMSAGAADRFKEGQYRHWDVARLGVKANLPDLLAALLPPQITAIDSVRTRRAEIDATYRAAFAGLGGVTMPAIDAGVTHAHHLFTLHVGAARRDGLLQHLAAEKIGATVNYNAVHTLTHYKAHGEDAPASLKVAEHWGRGVVSLPLFPALSDAQQHHVIRAVRGYLKATHTDQAQEAAA